MRVYVPQPNGKTMLWYSIPTAICEFDSDHPVDVKTEEDARIENEVAVQAGREATSYAGEPYMTFDEAIYEHVTFDGPSDLGESQMRLDEVVERFGEPAIRHALGDDLFDAIKNGTWTEDDEERIMLRLPQKEAESN